MSSIYAQIGERLRAHRRAAGLTQQAVAERAGLSVSFLSFLESGRKKGSLESYHRLAAALRVPLSALVDEPRRGLAAPRPFGHLTAAEHRAVWHLVRTLRRRK